jgi:adenylate cyclase
VVYGNLGAPDRLDFAAIGSAVNVASRIEGLCRELERRVLISEAVATHCAPSLPSAGSYSLRDSANPMAFYNLPETFLL